MANGNKWALHCRSSSNEKLRTKRNSRPMLKPRILTLILASCVLLFFAAGSTPGAEGKKRKKDSEKAKTEQTIENFFKSQTIPRIKIEIPADAMKGLRKYQWNMGPQAERDPV